MAATKTLDERKKDFIERLKKLYPDYILDSEYVNADTYIYLKHSDGYLWKTKGRFLDGVRQCPEIAALEKQTKPKRLGLTKDEWQKEIDNKFGIGEYTLEEYKSPSKLNGIRHTVCNKLFEVKLTNFMTYTKGCRHCFHKVAKTIEQVQNDLNVVDTSYKVLELHSKNGHRYMKCLHQSEKCNNSIFDMRVSDFVSKHAQRCPVCSILDNDSKAVKNIESFLNENNIEFSREIKIGAIYKSEMPYDFLLPKFNLIIEYDGQQHYQEDHIFNKGGGLVERQAKDEIKTKVALEKGYNFLRIKYTQDEIKTLSNYLKKLDKTMNCSV